MKIASLVTALPLLIDNLLHSVGFDGVYPYHSYVSTDIVSPRVKTLKWDNRPDHDHILLTPRGSSVPLSGPLILDARGGLIWADNRFPGAMDLLVQTYRGQDYLTFWAGIDDGTHGRGCYYMVSFRNTPATWPRHR
jgi:hypothetical protein